MNIDCEFFYCILPFYIKLRLAAFQVDIEAITEAAVSVALISSSDSVGLH